MSPHCSPAAYHKVWGTIVEALCAHFGEVAVCPNNELGVNWRLPVVKMQSDSIFSFLVALHLRVNRWNSRLFGANSCHGRIVAFLLPLYATKCIKQILDLLHMHHSRENRLPGAKMLAGQACITTFGELESASVHIYMQVCWQGAGIVLWHMFVSQAPVLAICSYMHLRLGQHNLWINYVSSMSAV